MWTKGEQCGGQSVSLACPAPCFSNPSQACSGHVNGSAKTKSERTGCSGCARKGHTAGTRGLGPVRQGYCIVCFIILIRISFSMSLATNNGMNLTHKEITWDPFLAP